MNLHLVRVVKLLCFIGLVCIMYLFVMFQYSNFMFRTDKNISVFIPHRKTVHNFDEKDIENKSPQSITDICLQVTSNMSFNTYLMPWNKVMLSIISINDSLKEEILRNGIGLKTLKTELGEEILEENGIQYRKFPFLENASNPYYTSHFEPYIPFNRNLFFERFTAKDSADITKKKIILWWQDKEHQAPINGLQNLRMCPDFPCYLSSDRKFTENSSAMLVNGMYVDKQMPPLRRPDQILVFYQIEAPFGYFWRFGDWFDRSKEWQGVFNWTMSYRMDADITSFYGLVRRRLTVPEKNYTAIVGNKTGIVAWMVSNCLQQSKRMDYVRELQKYVQVDIYGNCGPFKCSRVNDKDCIQILTRKYKFYLSFESKICKDYVTEKLYKYFDLDMILITRGHNSYSNILPSELFLNTANFKSPKDLANRINYLNSHDTEYTAMLKEKDKYVAIYEDYPLWRANPIFLEHRYEAASMCLLCQRLWNLEKYSKTIDNASKWFHDKEYQCIIPNENYT